MEKSRASGAEERREPVPRDLERPSYGVRMGDRSGRVAVHAHRGDPAGQVDGLARDRVGVASRAPGSPRSIRRPSR